MSKIGSDSDRVMSKRIRDNASISELGQMYKKGSDSNSDDLGHFRCILLKIFLYDPEPNRGMWEIGSGKYDPAPFRLPTVRNGHNLAGSGVYWAGSITTVIATFVRRPVLLVYF